MVAVVVVPMAPPVEAAPRAEKDTRQSESSLLGGGRGEARQGLESVGLTLRRRVEHACMVTSQEQHFENDNVHSFIRSFPAQEKLLMRMRIGISPIVLWITGCRQG